MQKDKHWYIVCYDIRDPKRWRKLYKILRGRGEHLQYSIFRVYLSKTQLEKLRWEISKILKDEDDLMIVQLCPNCAQRVIDSRGESKWKEPIPRFDIV